MNRPPIILWLLSLSLLLQGLAARLQGADWPQWGGAPARNGVAQAKNLAAQWTVGPYEEKTGRWLAEGAKNILWVARLGSITYGSPVVADGKIYCATNNGAGYLKRYPDTVDLGCLLCFGQADGQFHWQLSREKLAAGRELDYPEQGICCTPLVEGKRLWTVTNRNEVICVDTDGARQGEAAILWVYDMMKELGVVQHNMASCSVTAVGDLLLVNTSNGANDAHKRVAAPQAPSFIALDKRSGKLVWSDASPGANILHGQWCSPAFAVLGGVPQAIFPGGDGWVYSFKVGAGGKPELLWKFDCNPKASVWKEGGTGDRATLVATPVVADGRVYIATGEDPEFGEGPGRLWCIDPTRRGDVSPEVVLDKAGKPVPPRRVCNLDAAAGETVRPNPNSAAVWCYTGQDRDANGRLDFEEIMHRTLGMAVVKDGMLVIADLAGLIHCLDAATGKVHWTYDAKAAIWGSPAVADGKIYIGDEDGDVLVLAFSTTKQLLAQNAMGEAIYTTPVAVDDVLYISTRSHLVAVKAK